eukprot:c4722_g1_i1.p1 GENE.c4722_g1_i1~~c4722_g1_i1.p1  ORF type:complete len:157 (-),score=48.03 c4722_g1_i1:47-517(-)
MEFIPKPLYPLFLAPSSVIRIPDLRVKIPRVYSPPPILVFSALFFSYFLVMSGIVYDIIIEPPGMGSTQDPVTGQHKPVAFLQYRINGQYIIEGLSAGFMFSLGGLGFICLSKAQTGSTKQIRLIWLVVGSVLVAFGYNLSIFFIRIKIPGYLRSE